MQRKIVLTVSGPDRVGLVDEVTERLLALGGNVEVSRMIRLGGAFAILVLVSLPADRLAGLEEAVAALDALGYHAATTPAEGETAGRRPGWPAYRIEVTGADHEGIIHEIAHTVARFGINIESLETGVERAPISGAALFRMTALVAAPPELAGRDWAGELDTAGQRLNVEISVSAT